MQRCRQFVRRWPGVCLAVVLGACAAQSFAGMLSWCLHDRDGAHVTSAIEPCHGPVAGHDGAFVGQAGEAADDAVRQHADAPGSLHVAAASEAASGTATALPAVPFNVVWLLPDPSCAPGAAGAHRLPRRAPSAGSAPRPRLGGAVAGVSARLLI